MSQGNILMIDDEEDVRESLKLFLGNDYTVTEAENGEEAMQKIKSNGGFFSTSLILCDLHMPKVGGLECIEYFRKEAPGIPIVVITGFPDAEMAADLIARGCHSYLTKPVDKEKFLATVKKAISSKKGTSL